VALIEVLLDPPGPCESGGTTLADLGVDGDGVVDLWQAVCEEYGERTLSPEIEADVVEPAMTVTAAAAAMAAVLAGSSHRAP
jgi:hypothetical protein